VPQLRQDRAGWGRRGGARGDRFGARGASGAPRNGRACTVGWAGRRRGHRLLARCVASFAVCLVAASGRTGERFQPTRAGVAATVPRALGTTAGGGMVSPIPGTAPVTRTSTLTIRAGRRGACVTFQLKLSRGVSGVAAGTSYSWYIFTNVGRAACSMIGYPGVAILDAHGRVVQHPAVWSTDPGTMPPEPVRLVVLAVGQKARFVLASTDVTPSRGCRAPYSGRTLQVFPPNQTTALRARYHGSFCNLAVGPVQRCHPGGADVHGSGR
jgi:hypothetical protein